jgi:hypothetical protein
MTEQIANINGAATHDAIRRRFRNGPRSHYTAFWLSPSDVLQRTGVSRR